MGFENFVGCLYSMVFNAVKWNIHQSICFTIFVKIFFDIQGGAGKTKRFRTTNVEYGDRKKLYELSRRKGGRDDLDWWYINCKYNADKVLQLQL